MLANRVISRIEDFVNPAGLTRLTWARLATGGFLYWALATIRFIKLDAAIAKNGELSFLSKRRYDAFRTADIAYKYGRPLTTRQYEAVIHLQKNGVPMPAVRELVVANLLDKEGIVYHHPRKERVLYLIGWLFLLLVLCGLFLSLATTWASSANFFGKIVLTAGFTMFYWFIGYSMSHYLIRPMAALAQAAATCSLAKRCD